jgi:hypothetical protein
VVAPLDHGRDAVKRVTAIGLGLLLLGVYCAGCASREKVKVTSAGTPDYQELHVAYDVNDTGARAVDSPIVRSVGHVESIAEEPEHARRLRLEIEYPYPGIHPQFVHVTLRMLPAGPKGSADEAKIEAAEQDFPRGFSNSTLRPSASGLVQRKAAAPAPKLKGECLVIDMPKYEVDSLLVDLATDGFFDGDGKPDGESHLDVTCNKGQVEKGWKREPRLDDMVDMLKRYGTPAVN